MTYKLKFLPSAWKEWNKIGEVIREQFKKKLAERIENPIVPADQLKGFKNYYKIKLRSAGYRYPASLRSEKRKRNWPRK